MQNKILKNATWIIACKILQSFLQLLISVLSARYLGPSNYGVINYAASIVSFVIPIMQLGLRSILVKELLDDLNREGEILGTAIILNILSSLLCIIGVVTFTMMVNAGERVTIMVTILYSTSLIFQAIEMMQYWFQAKLLSKYTSLAMLGAHIIVSVYKIYLLIANKSVYWFAISQSIDYAVISLLLLLIYKRLGGRKLSFSLEKGKIMLSKSRYYIVSSMMVTIFAQTDKIMIKFLIGDSAVGQYSAAVVCAGITGFVYAAIIDTFRPVILELRDKNYTLYCEKIGLLSSIIFYLSLFQCVGMTVLSDIIVSILYGSEYFASSSILKILVWYTTFSYIGPVRNIWILAEEKHRYLWIINLTGAIGNVILNLIFIPWLGVEGAAIASFITQILTNFLLGFVIKPISEFNKIMCIGLNPRFTYYQIKKILKTLKKREP